MTPDTTEPRRNLQGYLALVKDAFRPIPSAPKGHGWELSRNNTRILLNLKNNKEELPNLADEVEGAFTEMEETLVLPLRALRIRYGLDQPGSGKLSFEEVAKRLPNQSPAYKITPERARQFVVRGLHHLSLLSSRHSIYGLTPELPGLDPSKPNE